MSRAHHQRVMDLFRDAVVLDDAAARRAYLDDACAGDTDLRAEVETMLAHDDDDSDAFGETALVAGRARIDATLAPPSSSPPLPERIGRYRPVRILGRGGMGVVYEAEQDAPRRTVALKMIRAGAMSPQHVRRFRLEAELLGRLRHPGIAQIYEAGTIDTGEGGQPFFAMELVEGPTITEHARANGLDPRERLGLFVRVCDAVQHAHQKGVVHRDLKPDNILVDPRGHVRILDFGVARATDSDVQVTTIQTDAGVLIGTVPYMSPEQVTGRSEEIDTRSDVYALGVVLFELLADRLPHDLRGRSILEAARIIREDDPTRLGSVVTTLRGDLDVIVAKTLEKEPDRRYQTAAELAADVQRYLASEPISARPRTTLYQLRRFARRHRSVVAGTVIAFIALAAGLVAAVIFALDARERAADAEWATYRAQIAAAAAATREGDIIAARGELAQVAEHLAGWETRHLRVRLDPTLVSRDAPPGRTWAGVGWPAGAQPRATLQGDSTARVIDANDGRVLATFDAEHELQWPLLSEDGLRVIAFEPATATFHAWTLDGSTHLKTVLDSSPGPPTHWTIDRTGSRLACGTGGTVRVIELDSGRSLLELASSALPFISRAGTHVALSEVERLSIVEIARGTVTASDPTPDARGRQLHWSPDDRRLAIASFLRRAVRLVDARTFETTLEVPRARTPVQTAVFAPDGRTLAIPREMAIDLWDLETRTRTGSLWGPTTYVAFEPGGRRIVTASPTTLRVLDGDAASPPAFHDTTFLYLAAFSPDDSLLATAGFSGRVQLWDVLDRRRVGVLDTALPWIEALSFSADGRALIAATHTHGDRRVQQWDVVSSTATTLAPLASRDVLRAGAAAVVPPAGVGLRRSADGSRFVAGTEHGTIVSIRDARSGATLLETSAPALAVAISGDNRMIATARDAAVQLLDGTTGAKLLTLQAPAGEAIYGLAFTPDDTRLVGAGRSGAIHFWHVATGTLICSFEAHTDYVHHVVFSDDGTRLATASGDGTAKILDSVSFAERAREREAMRARRKAMRETVVAWRADGADDATVAARLRADDTLTWADRRVLYDG